MATDASLQRSAGQRGDRDLQPARLFAERDRERRKRRISQRRNRGDFPADTGSAYDQWLGYLACRTGMACYYLPERLTKYRAHGGSSTQSASDEGSLGMFLLYARLMAMPELAGLRGEIEARCGA